MREFVFALDDSATPGTPVPMTPELRERGLDVIRSTVRDIGSFYRYPMPSTD